MSYRTSPPHFPFRGFVVPLAALVAVGALVVPEILSPHELKATNLEAPRDPDGDGLVNPQEGILGTNRFAADTDGDGFSDLEELARKSSPLFPESIPQGNEMSVGMTCRGGDAYLNAFIALYLPDGKLRDKNFRAGLYVGGRTIAFSQAYLLTNATLKLHPAQDPLARIATLSLPVWPRFLRCYGNMSVFATLGDASQGGVQAADSIHLITFGPMIVLELTNPTVLSTSGLGGSSQQSGGSGPSIGSIYVPMPLGSGVSDWAPGQVCFQQTALIGVAGAKITQEVVSAECQLGWDGYCPSNCQGSIGSTFTTIDPLGLLGG